MEINKHQYFPIMEKIKEEKTVNSGLGNHTLIIDGL